jgi:hypothetical protein
MPGFAELTKKFDPITTDWTYIRWLGDRKGIEKANDDLGQGGRRME